MLLERLKNNKKTDIKLNELQITVRNQVSAKVDDGTYKFEEIDCPVCLSKQREIVGQKDRYGLYFSTNMCTDCGMMYTSPRMTQESYNHFYNIDYRKLYVGEERATKKFFKNQRKQGKRIYAFLEKQKLVTDKPLFIFEVGCGAGGILDYFKEKGHQVSGIDLGEEYVKYGKEETWPKFEYRFFIRLYI